MEIKIIKESQNTLLIEFPNESETFVNLLKDELWNIKGVLEAAYIREHPELTFPKLWIKTEGLSPREALKKAISELINKLEKIKNLQKKE